MKKYYFLDKHKQWRGPYNYLQMLYMCLNSTVTMYSFVWNNKMFGDNVNTPLESIYARKYALDIHAFPKWIFKGYLKLWIFNITRKLKLKLSQKIDITNSWQNQFK